MKIYQGRWRMKKTTKVCKNNAGALFTFIPVDVIKRLKLKAGDRLDWFTTKDFTKFKKANPEDGIEPQD
jgi:hypothetical protein